ncbi:hypothetical protein H4219_001216 [Mycoemilia scoparia]|uniref:Chitin synthase n=1 Tax=Mycoemilia scoparia TaxID=417184 RepID=A0A9W8AA70_9FUNG|nr:hypothetical protein H4219_001216 [Mycoemilia scoparia]
MGDHNRQPYQQFSNKQNASNSTLDVLERTDPSMDPHNRQNPYNHHPDDGMVGGDDYYHHNQAPHPSDPYYHGDNDAGYDYQMPHNAPVSGHHPDDYYHQHPMPQNQELPDHRYPPPAPNNSSGYLDSPRPLPTPTPSSLQNLRIAAPSPHPVPLMEARPFTPQEQPSLADMAQQEQNAMGHVTDEKMDPRIKPEMDEFTSSLLNVDNAPPEGARRYEDYNQQRSRQLRQVALTSGNLVLDCPVPKKVLEMGRPEFRSQPECTHLRYTACTSDPNHFANNKYVLRQAMYLRQTELFIVLTMYNEDEKLFNRTFIGVMKNIRHLCSRTRSRVWGQDAWKKVVVCVVSDGRAKIHPKVRTVLGVMGVFQEGIMQNTVSGKPVQAHIFEYTVQFGINEKNAFVGHEKSYPPVQVLFCLKEKNAKKINSHRWFFNAFSEVLKPKVCVLIDVGTKPTATSIYHLWKSFDKNPKIAGACGEICADVGKGCCNLWNPLVAAQNFEYKISNILDKPLESIFGYISVLPGAFSAYRYEALQGAPLYAYFKGETLHSGIVDEKAKKKSSGIFEANMYLAEDRILCFELVAKQKCKYLLRYVKASKAYTDVPDNLFELISQRRRWLNGSFFATFYALVHWYKMWGTSHNIVRQFVLILEFIYQIINMIFSWFTLGNFYLTYYFIQQNIKRTQERPEFKDNKHPDPFQGAGYIVMEVFRELYIIAIVTQIVLSLGNRPQGTKFIYTLTVVLFTLIMIVLTYAIFYSVIYSAVHIDYSQGVKKLIELRTFRDIVISVISTYGIYFISSFLYFEPWHMFTSFIQYMLWLPSSINILMVYAFCNIHDVSWGTKGDNTTTSDQGHAKVDKRQDGVEVAHVNVAADQETIDSHYESFLREYRTKLPEEPPKVDYQQVQDDLNKKVRTYTLLAWIFSNLVLVLLIGSEWFDEKVNKVQEDGSFFNPYLTFIFWSVAALSFFRFIGSTLYIVRHWIFGD